MPALSRKGDKNQTGGRLVRGANNVFAEGIQVALHVSKITPHNPKPKKKPHCCAQTTQGSPTVFAEGVPVVRVGSGNSCGHSIVQGCRTVFVP